MQTAAYTRYSSDQQRQTSTDDQVALLRALAARLDLPEPAVYSDSAISGTHTHRPALQRLLADAEAGRINMLLVEDLSRLSCDLGDSDRILKRLDHSGVRVICADGFDSANGFARMQAGLQGIMNEAYIADLARRPGRPRGPARPHRRRRPRAALDLPPHGRPSGADRRQRRSPTSPGRNPRPSANRAQRGETCCRDRRRPSPGVGGTDR